MASRVGVLAASVIPLRLVMHLLQRAQSSARAGILGRFLATFPVIVALLAVQLAGEIAGYVTALRLARGMTVPHRTVKRLP